KDRRSAVLARRGHSPGDDHEPIIAEFHEIWAASRPVVNQSGIKPVRFAAGRQSASCQKGRAKCLQSQQLLLRAVAKQRPPNKAIGARVAELRSALRRIWIAEAAAGLELLPQPAVTVATSLRCALKS